MMKPFKKRRPWNVVSEQVYSIASKSINGVCNMNIATYVTPVTMDPKRYMIAVYKNTQTYTNLIIDKQPFLLQALTASQVGLVKVLGKKSGLTYNKEAYLAKKQYPCDQYNTISYLTDSLFVLSMIPEQYITVGDHDLVIARVEKIITQQYGEGLTTTILQDSGIIG